MVLIYFTCETIQSFSKLPKTEINLLPNSLAENANIIKKCHRYNYQIVLLSPIPLNGTSLKNASLLLLYQHCTFFLQKTDLTRLVRTRFKIEVRGAYKIYIKKFCCKFATKSFFYVAYSHGSSFILLGKFEWYRHVI